MANSATRIHHINCGTLHRPPRPRVGCHCLLLEDEQGLALVDTGIGLLDVQRPAERIGQLIIDMAGFQFSEPDTAVRQIEALGFKKRDVKHLVLTHGDQDHAGGLADFPNAIVHVAQEEIANISKGSWRYSPAQFAHRPRWTAYGPSRRRWYGLQARPVALGFAAEVLLIPLFGHTHGHCGVAIQWGDGWVLHAGDAYYLRTELTDEDHPVSQLAAQSADDDVERRKSQAHLKRLVREHHDEIELFGYHDLAEFPGAYLRPCT